MAFNTLKADLVTYADRGMNIVVNNGSGTDVTVSSKPSKATPVGKDVAQVDDKHNWNNITEGDETLQFGERYFSNLKKTGEIDSFGRPATVWKYKADEIGTYIDTSKLVQSWTAKAPKGELHSAIGGSIVDKLGKDNDKSNDNEGYRFTAYCDGKLYSEVYEGNVKTEAHPGVASDRDKIIELYFDKNSTKAAGSAVDGRSKNIGVSGNGVLTELYMDDNDNVTVVMINTYLVQATSDYNTSTERVSIEVKDIDESKTGKDTADRVPTNFLPAYIENDDFDVTGVKEDDYLLVTASKIDWTDTTKKASIKSVTPATVQTGTVTEYTEKDNVTVGGTKYSYNKILGEEEKDEEFAINSEAALILDTYGYIMKVDDAITSSNFVFVDKAVDRTAGLSGSVIANAYFTDGTGREITITKCNSKKKADAIKAEVSTDGNWFVFSGGNNGEYVLNKPNTNRYDSTKHAKNIKAITGEKFDLIKSSNVKFMSNAQMDGSSAPTANVKADDKTIFVIKDYDDDVTAYTGIANVPTVTLKKTYTPTAGAAVNLSTQGYATVDWLCKKDSEYASYVFIDVSAVDEHLVDIDGGNTTADYMFVLKATKNKTHVDGKEYYKYTVVIDGKEEERWISDTLVDGDKKDNGRLFYNVREDGEGYITNGKEVGQEGSNKTRYLGVMNFAGETTTYNAPVWVKEGDVYKLKDDTVVLGSYTVGSDTHVTTFTVEQGVRKASNNIKKNGSSVLNIPALAGVGKSEVIVNSKSNLNLVIGPDADDLLGKSGADYDAYLGTSVNNITSTLSGYNLAGRVYLITTDDEDSSTVDTLWIYVNGTKKITQ